MKYSNDLDPREELDPLKDLVMPPHISDGNNRNEQGNSYGSNVHQLITDNLLINDEISHVTELREAVISNLSRYLLSSTSIWMKIEGSSADIMDTYTNSSVSVRNLSGDFKIASSTLTQLRKMM